VTALEDELRDSLARQASSASSAHPDPDELAGRVVRRAQLVRRRQRMAGVTVTTAIILLVGMVVVYLPARQAAQPVAEPSSPPAVVTPAAAVPPTITGDVPGRLHGQQRALPKLPIDVVADDQLVTVDGAAIDVSFAGEVSQAYRVAEGWLVVGVPRSAARASVWLVTAAGERQTLLSGVDGVAFDVAGQQVAWRVGTQVFLGSLSGGRLGQQQQTVTVAGTAVPVGFVAGAVLLARGGLDGYDLWWPDRGIYQPNWAQTAVAVYGSLPDGRTAVGQVLVDATVVAGLAAVGERRCLALFDAAFQTPAHTSAGTSAGGKPGGKVGEEAGEEAGGKAGAGYDPDRARAPREAPVQTLCGLGSGARSPGWVSPDGRWLVTGAGGRTVLVDLLARSTAKPQVLSSDPPFDGGVAWLDKQTVVLATSAGKAVMRLRLDDLRGKQAGVKQWSIPVAAKEAVLVVPRLQS
jgi:hypothetical protein